jgi:hypothetical protein
MCLDNKKDIAIMVFPVPVPKNSPNLLFQSLNFQPYIQKQQHSIDLIQLIMLETS